MFTRTYEQRTGSRLPVVASTYGAPTEYIRYMVTRRETRHPHAPLILSAFFHSGCQSDLARKVDGLLPSRPEAGNDGSWGGGLSVKTNAHLHPSNAPHRTKQSLGCLFYFQTLYPVHPHLSATRRSTHCLLESGLSFGQILHRTPSFPGLSYCIVPFPVLRLLRVPQHHRPPEYARNTTIFVLCPSPPSKPQLTRLQESSLFSPK